MNSKLLQVKTKTPDNGTRIIDVCQCENSILDQKDIHKELVHKVKTKKGKVLEFYMTFMKCLICKKYKLLTNNR